MGKRCKNLVTYSHLPSVASKRVHARKKHVLIGCEHDMFCHVVDLICFHSTKYSLQVLLGIKNNF